MKFLSLGIAAVALTACASVETNNRTAPFDTRSATSTVAAVATRDYRVHSVRFAVPDDMTVSEANSYYPIADIVWRGDPIGDRPQQISEIFQTSVRAAGNSLNGSVPITVDIELARFHSLTERARYSVGGVNSIKFDLTVRNANTGEVIEERRRINGDFPALGGFAALAADNEGQTQKVRVISHLTSLFLRELSGQTTRMAAN